jgi:hypothetical protein
MGGSPGTAFTTCDDPIVFDEINYNSDTLLNAGDWVELYNRSSSGINLTGYSLKDSKDDNIYFFPTNTQIAAGGRLVIVHDIALFTARHPTVTNYLGSFAFNLSNDGEVIRLFNAQGKLSYSVVFDDDGDWPSGADGDGYTLELLDPVANVNSSTDWFDGCIEGSPGFAYDPDCNIGVFDPEPKQALQVLHNLSSDYVEIIIPASGAYSPEDMIIYNGLGEVVLKTKAAGSSLSVNVSRFPAGLYIVSVKNDRHFVTGKFLVQ